jgi:hypothetical protein
LGELEAQLKNVQTELVEAGSAWRRQLDEYEAKLEAARAHARGLAEDVARKDEALRRLAAAAEAAAERAAEALRDAKVRHSATSMVRRTPSSPSSCPSFGLL